MNGSAFLEVAERIGLHLTEEQVHAFTKFEERLYDANQRMNLTRIPREECWLRHFIDSLLFQDLMPLNGALLDIGTGPGFPAWPLACARPDLEVTALDSNGKMLGFLRENPLPNLKVVQERAEEWGVREQYDFVTGRAVAPLATQLELSAAPCRVGGQVVPMRTGHEETVNVSVLGLDLQEVVARPLPGTEAVRVFPIYVKNAKTPVRYPRRWAEMKAKPL